MLKLDKLDLKIVEVLRRDGRITKLGLAEAVGLSAAACWERLHRLEASGVIEGYGARINPALLGPAVTVLVAIVLRRHQAPDFQCFEDAVARLNEVIACDAVGGGIDYMLRITTADVPAYQRFIDDLLQADIGIDRYFSYVVTKSVKAMDLPPAAPLSFPPAETD